MLWGYVLPGRIEELRSTANGKNAIKQKGGILWTLAKGVSSLHSYSLCTYTIQRKQCFHTCTVQQKQPSLQRHVKLPAVQRASQISLNPELLFLKKSLLCPLILTFSSTQQRWKNSKPANESEAIKQFLK